jgi:redox-sensitive bicupin YhaK (pirin superfamily)
MGNGSVIRPGDVQRMSAGGGIAHSEFNASAVASVHFLRIWILPERHGIAPGYEQTAFADARIAGRLCLVASHDGRDGSLTIHRDADVYACRLACGQTVRHAPAADRGLWMQMIRGSVIFAGEALAAGDGAAVGNSAAIEVAAASDAGFLLFDPQ